MEQIANRTDGHSTITVTTLRVKGLNTAIKRHSITINKKQDPTMLCLQEMWHKYGRQVKDY